MSLVGAIDDGTIIGTLARRRPPAVVVLGAVAARLGLLAVEQLVRLWDAARALTLAGRSLGERRSVCAVDTKRARDARTSEPEATGTETLVHTKPNHATGRC